MSRSQADSSSPMKSAPVSPQKEHVGLKCACGHEAIRLISKTKKNPDRPFYKCPLADSDDGCRLFKWEDEISGPSYQTGPRTPSSSQSQSSQTTTQTPLRASTSSSSLVKTPWTNQTPSRPPMSTNPSKRKRSPSPSPTPSPSTSTMRGRDGVIPSTSRSSLAFGPIDTDAANAFSMSVANPVASTSAGGGRCGSAFPAKRAKVDNAAGSMFSDDEELWADAVLDANALPVEGERRNEERTVSSAQPLKKSVSFQELNGGGGEDLDDEDGILVDANILRLIDFKNKRGPSPDRLINLHVRDGTTDDFPITDNDPLNPFRTHKPPSTTSNKPSTSYTNGTPARTSSILPASSPLVGTSSTGLLLTNTSPASTDPMPTFSRLEELLPDLVSAFPDLRQKVTKLERRQAADAKSIDAKLKRIRALEEEVRELEEMREENSRLREENARLRRV